jgi:enoyl-CoA hydratase/carnithine racemase
MSASDRTITTERRGHVLLIGLNRPAKRNAFDMEMLDLLSMAYAELEDTQDLRCGVLFAEGEMFTAGIDLATVGPKVVENGHLKYPDGAVDPLGVGGGRTRTKPMVVAVHGKCLTIGIELMLAADIRIASENATFAQIEIKRGIFPFGGATIRFPQVAGWGNAMRWLLTGDEFDAAEALRIGLVQEVMPQGEHISKAIEIAETISRQAPLGVQATITSARTALTEGAGRAIENLTPQIMELFRTDDASEGVASFLERRDGNFTGR